MTFFGWITALAILTAAYGCAAFIAGYYGLSIGLDGTQKARLFLNISPWVLIILSAYSWHRSLIWRRMSHARHMPPSLSRGDHTFRRPVNRPSALEIWSRRFLFLGLVTLPYWFGLSGPEWYIVLGGLIVIFLKMTGSALSSTDNR